MIIGGHIMIQSRDVEADIAFFRDVLKFPHVDAGGGFLLFSIAVGGCRDPRVGQERRASALFDVLGHQRFRQRDEGERPALRPCSTTGMGLADGGVATGRRQAQRLSAASCPTLKSIARQRPLRRKTCSDQRLS